MSPHPRVIYRCDQAEQVTAMTQCLGPEFSLQACFSDADAIAALAVHTEQLAAIIIDLADLDQVTNSLVFAQAPAQAPHAIRIVLHNAPSLEALQVLLKSRAIDRCFSKPADCSLLRSEVFAASLKLNLLPNARENASAASGPLGVLLVDDEVTATKYLRKQLALQCPDFNVYCVESAVAALELLEQDTCPIALVISDQRMPGMQGKELLKTLRHRYPGILRVLTSAYHDVEVALGAVNESEIFQYLNKPWQTEELIQCIREALAEYRQRCAASSDLQTQLLQRHHTALQQRRSRIDAALRPLLDEFRPADIVTDYLNLLQSIDTLPPSPSSTSAEREDRLDQELCEGLTQALGKALHSLPRKIADRPIEPWSTLRQAWRQQAEAFETAMPEVKLLLRALNALLEAAGETAAVLQFEQGDHELKITTLRPLTLLSHALAPLTRITPQLIRQQSALLLLLIATHLLGGIYELNGGPQCLWFSLRFSDEAGH